MSVINTNVTALIGQSNLSKAQNSMSTAMERLSSGLRINSASDDAAGQAIANRMTAQITGMNQASRNANDGVSLVQTMEGGLDQVSDNLQRIRELAVQAANDTNTAEDRASIKTEIEQRLSEIDRIAGSNTFNGINLLNDDASTTLQIQVGANTSGDDTIGISLFDAQVANIVAVGNATADDLEFDASIVGISAGATINAVVGALGGATASGNTIFDSHGIAQQIVDWTDKALENVDDQRATLGATLNRFDSVIANLDTASTNLSEARSRIQDADYAVEVSNMTRAQILQQAGTSMLAQANQTPQSVLSLLG